MRRDVVFVIADLSGYTALTEVHGGGEAAKVVARYVELVTGALAAGTRVVERVGDEILIVAETAAVAARTAIAIRTAVEREPLFPDVRIAIHGGPVVEEDGRYFGAALNVTARIAAHATAGRILCSEAVAAALQDEPYVECRPLATVRFKNVVDAIPLCEVNPAVDVHPIDPVCRMQVVPECAAARMVSDGRTYYFCSPDCAVVFARRPSTYIAAMT